MASRSGGLRNRRRSRGRSTYARLGKNRDADYYGEWHQGRMTVPEKLRKWSGDSDDAKAGAR